MAKSKREKQLERIILDIYWMARRYAHGRQTYAVGMCNGALASALDLGLLLQSDSVVGGFYAKDGMEGLYAKTTDDEETGC